MPVGNPSHRQGIANVSVALTSPPTPPLHLCVVTCHDVYFSGAMFVEADAGKWFFPRRPSRRCAFLFFGSWFISCEVLCVTTARCWITAQRGCFVDELFCYSEYAQAPFFPLACSPAAARSPNASCPYKKCRNRKLDGKHLPCPLLPSLQHLLRLCLHYSCHRLLNENSTRHCIHRIASPAHSSCDDHDHDHVQVTFWPCPTASCAT